MTKLKKARVWSFPYQQKLGRITNIYWPSDRANRERSWSRWGITQNQLATATCHRRSKGLISHRAKVKDPEQRRLSGARGLVLTWTLTCLMQHSRLLFSVVLLPQSVEYGVSMQWATASTPTFHIHHRERRGVPFPGVLLVSRVPAVQLSVPFPTAQCCSLNRSFQISFQDVIPENTDRKVSFNLLSNSV